MEIDQKEWFNLTEEEKRRIIDDARWIIETNERLSTEILESDVENNRIIIHLPKEVAAFIEMEEGRRKAVEEMRKKKEGLERFPEGSVAVLNLQKFFDDISDVEKMYLFEQYSSITFQMVENTLKMIFERLQYRHPDYIKYI